MRDFRIAAAQIASVRGDIERNIGTHAAAIAAAARHEVSVAHDPGRPGRPTLADLSAGARILLLGQVEETHVPQAVGRESCWLR